MVLESLHYRGRKLAVQSLTRPNLESQLSEFESDWDVAIVLDACRADTLQRKADWPIQTVHSPASLTPEWLRRVETAGILSDCHVVSANPQYQNVNCGARTVEPVWESHWDEELQTVPPEPVLDRVSELVAAGESPVLAHLMQPHWPYIARVDDSWQQAYEDERPWISDGEEIDSVQVAMERGFVDMQAAIKAYRASVSSVWRTLLPYVDEWMDEATVIVTSDHGETFGRLSDWGFYEHPYECHIPPLTRVPWVEFGTGENRLASSGTPEERLKALGYA